MILQNISPVTKNLLIINGLFFFATSLFEIKGIDLSVILGAFYPGSPNFNVWQILTHMFMHGNLPHLLFNMFALFSFGTTVERTIGSKKFLMLYILAGLGGFFLFNAFEFIEVNTLISKLNNLNINPDEIYHLSKLNINGDLIDGNIYNTPDAINLLKTYINRMVGASGAIYGLLTAFAVLYPDAKIAFIFFPVGIKAKYLMPLIILGEFFLGAKNYNWDNIAHYAHLGGALIGFLLVKYWNKNLYRKY